MPEISHDLICSNSSRTGSCLFRALHVAPPPTERLFEKNRVAVISTKLRLFCRGSFLITCAEGRLKPGPLRKAYVDVTAAGIGWCAGVAFTRKRLKAATGACTTPTSWYVRRQPEHVRRQPATNSEALLISALLQLKTLYFVPIACQCMLANCGTNTRRLVWSDYVLHITTPIELCIIYPEMWVFAHTRLAIVSRPLMPC